MHILRISGPRDRKVGFLTLWASLVERLGFPDSNHFGVEKKNSGFPIKTFKGKV